MRLSFVTAAILLIAFFVVSVEPKVFTVIDPFTDVQSLEIILTDGDNRADNGWYSPYKTGEYDANNPYIGPPKVSYLNTPTALGGQRDLVIGHVATTPDDVASMLVISGTFQIAFPLDWLGTAYCQFDGIDNPGGPDEVFPGAMLNGAAPYGIGSDPLRPSADGRTVDLTSGGAAKGFRFSLRSDKLTNGAIDVIDVTGAQFTFTFQYRPLVSGVADLQILRAPFDSTLWTTANGQRANFAAIAAVQLSLFTRAVAGEAQSPDALLRDLGTYGYSVIIRVQRQCECTGTTTPVVNQAMSVFVGSSTTNPVAALTTTSNGTVELTGLDAGTYQVCLPIAGSNLCPAAATSCRTFTFANFVDPPPINFVINAQESLVAPPAATVNCGQLMTPNELGTAEYSTCAGEVRPISTFTDTTGTSGCTSSVTRTFTTNGLSATQLITIRDPDAPLLTVPARDFSRECSDTSSQTFQAWVSDRAGARWTDCTIISYTNNATALQNSNCGRTPVRFTATDQCGQASTVVASYIVTDTTLPTFTTAPVAQTVPCDRTGSDIAALNAYLARNGGAVATDNCGAAVITNNFVAGSLVRGCNAVAQIVFRATDACGNQATAESTFTISDSTGPTFTAPSPQSAECGPNAQAQYQAYLSSNGGAVATDACDVSSQIAFTNNGPTALPISCGQTTPITFTARDSCGRTTSVTGSFTVTDRVAPVVATQPSPLSISCGANGNSNTQLQSWLSNNGGAVFQDACSTTLTFNNTFTNAPTSNCGGVPVRFTACDPCNNCVSVTSSYSVTDTVPPTFSNNPANLAVSCVGDVQAAYTNWLTTNAGAVAQDNCADTSAITFINNGTSTLTNIGCTTVVSVLFRARDQCGNINAGVVATFSVVDNAAPVWNPLPAPLTVECNSQSLTAFTTWRNSRAGGIATDACSNVNYQTTGVTTIGLPTTPGVCTVQEQLTFTASDTCGNSNSVTVAFTIRDNATPRFTREATSQTAECGSNGVNAWLQSNGGAIAVDDCSTVRITNDFVALSGTCNRSALVTFTATDQCGLNAVTRATYSVRDTIAPVFSPGASPLNVPCSPETRSLLTQYLATRGGAVAQDACQSQDQLSYTNNFQDVAALSCNTVTITFTVTDECGNAASTIGRFTSVDSDPPTFVEPATSATFPCNANGNTADYAQFITNRANARAVDECAITGNYTVLAPTVGPTNCGTVQVTVVATDSCGNSARSTASYTVEDNVEPIFNPLPTSVTVNCDGTNNAAALQAFTSSNGGAAATDNCAATVNIVSTAAPPTSDNCRRETVYTFNAADSCGNVATAIASFIVVDVEAPVFTTNPTPGTFECDGSGNTNQINTYLGRNGGAVANDVCQGSVTYTNDYNVNTPLLTCRSVGVIFTATDRCGNSATASSVIEITDVTPPVWTFFPEDKVVPCDADTSVENLGMAVASDVCAGNDLVVTMTEELVREPAVGDCPGDVIITRDFTTVDQCGNTLTRSQTITVRGQRGSGPCPPENCECDGCCPPPAASDCLPVDCSATTCNSTPCSAVPCTCGAKEAVHVTIRNEEEIPQCKPVYIYVNDDDDTEPEMDSTSVAKQQRTFVSNVPLHF